MANHFDRIIKENINALFSFFAKREGIEIKKAEDIKDKLQVTLEREADFLQKILHDDSDEDFILHFEFQTEEELIMVRRLLLYRGILFHKTGLRVKQFVIYLGDSPSKMPSLIEQEDLSFRFTTINLCTIAYQELLESGKPEAIILAILANFKAESPHDVVAKVLAKLVSAVENRLLLSKYVIQLQVLSNLRNLQAEVHQNIHKMAFTTNIDLTQDPLFKEAIDQGLEQGLERDIIRLLKSKILSHLQIAEVMEVPLSRVIDLQKKIDEKLPNNENKEKNSTS